RNISTKYGGFDISISRYFTDNYNCIMWIFYIDISNHKLIFFPKYLYFELCTILYFFKYGYSILNMLKNDENSRRSLPNIRLENLDISIFQYFIELSIFVKALYRYFTFVYRYFAVYQHFT